MDTIMYAGASVVDLSGAITTGGTAQALVGANPSRRGFKVFNASNGDLWINDFGATAVAASPSERIPSGATYASEIGGATIKAISIIGATTGQAFTAREW